MSSFNVPPPPPRPIPDEGYQNAICVAVVDMGEVLSDFPGKEPEINRCARFFFELEQTIPDHIVDAEGRSHPVDAAIVGKPFMLSTYDIALKVGEKANFRKLLKGWLGTKNCPEKLVGFPLMSLVGKAATLNVQHKERDDGSLLAFIKAEHVGPGMPNAKKLIPQAKTLPPWVDEAKKKNADAVAAFLRKSNQRAANAGGFDEVPYPIPGEEHEGQQHDGSGLPVPF